MKKDPYSLSIKDLEKVIKYCNREYRNGTEVIDDETYDEYIDILREKDPKSRFLREIGAPVRDDLVKVKLPYWMGSMDKVKPNSKELDRWIEKYEGPYFCTAKLDGISCLYGGDMLYTRGDGNVGQDISYLIPYLNLPLLEDKKIYVRGELIMEKDIFKKKYADDFPKGRSVVAGLINSKKPDPKILRDVVFVSYELISRDLRKASEQLDILAEWNFKIPYHISLPSNFDKDELTPLLQEMKLNSLFEIDGMVIVDDNHHSRNISGNPKFAIAYKVNSKGIKTTIEDVIWEPSMHGLLKPKIHFRMVVIDGDEVEYATAFNAKYVKNNHLRRGVEVKIVKSGDVIPYIMEVLTSSKVMTADMPHEDVFGKFRWNETEVDLELVSPFKNSIVRRKRFVHFFKSLSIKYISDGIVAKFIEGGYETPKEIYDASVEDLMELDGIQKKNAQKFYDSIHLALDNPIPVETIMKASLALGKGLGERKLNPLITGIQFISGKKGKYEFRKPSLEEIIDIKGFSYKTGRQFRDNFHIFVEFMNMNNYIELEISGEEDEKDDDLPLKGKFIYFTGGKNKDLSDKFKKLGAEIEANFTNKTNVLVVKDKSISNNKTEKAKQKGIPIYSMDEVNLKLSEMRIYM